MTDSPWTPATGDTIAEVGGTLRPDDSEIDRPMLYRVEAAQPHGFYLRRLWVEQRPIRYEAIDHYGRLFAHRFIPTTEWEEIDPGDRDHPIQEYWDDASCFDCNSIIGGHLASSENTYGAEIEYAAWNTAFAHPTHPAWLCEDCHDFYTRGTDGLDAGA